MSKVDEIKEIHENYEQIWSDMLKFLPDCSRTIGLEQAKLKAKFYTQFNNLFEQKVREIFEWIKSKMALEQCDTDTMPYFTDYYWIPKDVLQDLAAEYLDRKEGEDA